MGELDYQAGISGPGFPAMHRRLGAPLGGEAADSCVGVLVETQQITDHAAVQQRPVRVGVGEVGGLQLFVPELVEDRLRHAQLLVTEGAEVKDGQGFDVSDGSGASTTLLPV